MKYTEYDDLCIGAAKKHLDAHVADRSGASKGNRAELGKKYKQLYKSVELPIKKYADAAGLGTSLKLVRSKSIEDVMIEIKSLPSAFVGVASLTSALVDKLCGKLAGIKWYSFYEEQSS